MIPPSPLAGNTPAIREKLRIALREGAAIMALAGFGGALLAWSIILGGY